MLRGTFTRGLDVSEAYFELVGRTWPMNALCAIEFNEAVAADRVERAWNRLAEQVRIIGAHVERTSGRNARMVFGTPRGTLPVARYDDVESAWANESITAIDIGIGPVVRCSLVDQDAGATVVLTSHHAILEVGS